MQNLKSLASKGFSGNCPNCGMYVATVQGKYGPYLSEFTHAYDNGARYKRGPHKVEVCENRAEKNNKVDRFNAAYVAAQEANQAAVDKWFEDAEAFQATLPESERTGPKMQKWIDNHPRKSAQPLPTMETFV